MELLFVSDFSSLAHDLFDVFFETHFEHHIGLIELDDLDHDLLREMGVASVGHRIQILNARDARY